MMKLIRDNLVILFFSNAQYKDYVLLIKVKSLKKIDEG